MAIHYVSPIGHATCETKSGSRRSPMIGPSYDADQPLLDEATGRTIYRPHKDGTVIWGTDIVSHDRSCPYGDRSVPSQKRRQDMYNDLYGRLKKRSQRYRAHFNVALPNGFTREQANECAERMALSFSEKFSRPSEYSIHFKPNNLHVHFAMPEWEWTDGKWKALKVESHYIDKEGNPIYGKNYLDENGNDIRVPYLDENGEQKRGKKNDRLWKRVYSQTFDPARCGWLHAEVDRQINLQLELNNSADRVIRPDREIRDALKKAGLYAEHIGPQSYKEKDGRFLAKKEKERRLKQFEASLTDNKRKQILAQNTISSAEHTIDETSKGLEEKLQELKALDAEMEQDEKKNILGNYIEKELEPQKIFADEATDRYNMYLSEKRKISQPLIDSLDLGVQATQSAIAGINGNADATERDLARAKFLSKNVSLMIRLRGAVYGIAQTDFGKKVRSNATRKWNRLSVWARCHYIKSRCGDEDALIYREHHKLTGKISDDEKFIPKPINIPNTEKLENQCRTVADAWSSSMQSPNHIPPTDFGILSEILSAEATITETMPEEIFAIPDGKEYASATEANRREYEAELAEIAQREAEAERIRLEEERRRQEEAERKRRLAEQERREQILAERERIRQEKLAEQERIRRQKLAEQKRREEQKRIAEAKLAEQKRLAEKRRQEEELAEKRRLEEEAKRKQIAEREHKKAGNRQPVPGNVTAPPRQPQRQNVASAKGKTGGTVAPRYTKADYYELSDRANIFKLFTVIETARKALADGTKTFSNVLDGIEYYTKHSKHFDRDRKAYGIDFGQYEKIQVLMKQIWVMVKDQEYERPAMINQRPPNYLTVDQCKAEENHLTQLMQKAQAEKARLMPAVVEKSVAEYMNQENSRRRKYNAQHVGEKDFVRQPSIGFEEAGKELRKLFAKRDDVFVAMADEHRIDVSAFTNILSEANGLKKILDDNYIYHTLEDRQKRQQTKKAPTRTEGLEHVRGK